MNIITERAIAAIGPVSKGDWKIEPEKHAEGLPPEARLLRDALMDAELQHVIEKFRTHDEEASRAQWSYKWKAMGAAFASFLALVLGSVLVLPGYRFMTAEQNSEVGIAQTVLVGLSILLLLGNELRNPFRRWMEQRSLAEETRMNLFERVLAIKQQSPGQQNELPLLPLQLEYLRRYLLESQRKYYERHGTRAKWALRGAYFLRGVALLLLIIAGLPLLWDLRGESFIPGWLDEFAKQMPEKSLFAQHVFLALALAGVALKVLVDSHAAISLNYRGAWRYPLIVYELDNLADPHLADARADAAAGEAEPVMRFADSVQKKLMLEHQEWLAIAKIPERR
jgi:multisubunit Na+/H+ antiporter MnhB subunit